MRMSVPQAVRSSMLIQFSPVVPDLDLPFDDGTELCVGIDAGRTPPDTGRKPSGTS